MSTMTTNKSDFEQRWHFAMINLRNLEEYLNHLYWFAERGSIFTITYKDNKAFVEYDYTDRRTIANAFTNEGFTVWATSANFKSDKRFIVVDLDS